MSLTNTWFPMNHNFPNLTDGDMKKVFNFIKKKKVGIGAVIWLCIKKDDKGYFAAMRIKDVEKSKLFYLEGITDENLITNEMVRNQNSVVVNDAVDGLPEPITFNGDGLDYLRK